MSLCRRNRHKLQAAAWAALAAAIGAGAAPALAATNTAPIVISCSGSSALKNFTVDPSMGWVDNGGNPLTLSNGTYAVGTSMYATPLDDGTGLNPSTSDYKANNVGTTNGPGVIFEWHNTGSVEGILELAADQVPGSNPPAGSDLIPRDPTGGNPIIIMQGASSNGGNSFAALGTQSNQTLGTFASGNGVNKVQFAISDVVPAQAFSQPGTSNLFNTNPGSAGYGQGDTTISTSSANNFGTAGTREQLADANATLPSFTVNGHTSTAGVSQLISRTVAVTATAFAANPGTGLTRIDKTDAQFLDASSRLQNGLSFNMTTRDVGSGTRNVAALSIGLDPSWAGGKNDAGNGYASNNTTTQINIGPGMTFSNKSSGGKQLLPVLINNRMSVGTIGLSDVQGNAGKGNTTNNAIRALDYANTVEGSDPTNTIVMNDVSNGTGTNNGSTGYGAEPAVNVTGTTGLAANTTTSQWVRASAATIATGAYPIIQNEQYVFVNTPGTSNGTCVGDDAAGDVKTFTNNILNSASVYPNNATNSPAVGLVSKGFIPTDTMIVQYANSGTNPDGTTLAGVDGTSNSLTAVANAGGANTTNLYGAGSVDAPQGNNNSFLSYGAGNAKFYISDPSTITTGTGSVYGGANSVASGGNVGTAVGQLGSVAITNTNWLVGNFNQNGVRDLSAVQTAQKAQAAMYTASSRTTLFNQVASDTWATGSVTYTGSGGSVTVTNGDLIVMGDMAGRGVFDGESLYDLAYGAACSTGTGQTTLTVAGGSTGLSDALRNATLRKNTAMNYMQQNATAQQKADVVAYAAVNNSYNGSTAGNKSTTSAWSATNASANAFNKYDILRTGIGNLAAPGEQVYANLIKNASVVVQMSGLNATALSDQMSAATVVTAALSTTGAAYRQRINDAIFTDGNTTVNASRTDTTSDLYPYLHGVTLADGSYQPGIEGIFNPASSFGNSQINAFVEAIGNPGRWESDFYPDLVGVLAPSSVLNLIGSFDNLNAFGNSQINGFVAAIGAGQAGPISGAAQTAPEPASLVMLALGGCLLLRRRARGERA